ncbi:DDE-type integrase/transposase/recombinase [Gordonia zhaorongruii]|uniref:DDE-type integrase/transposase/recombinase n=1 Tax=Gordonia zhaorongruii TaxID=2597659 RepID=UPI00105252E5
MDRQTRWYRRTSWFGPGSLRMDETYVKVGGNWCCLYCPISKHGQTSDFYLSPALPATRFSTPWSLVPKSCRPTRHRARTAGPECHRGTRMIAAD